MSVASARAASRRRAGLVGAAVLTLLALVIGILAVMDKGYAGPEVETHNGGVWVKNDELGLVGRLNVEAQQFDARLQIDTTRELFQSGSTVLLRTESGLERINPASHKREGRAALGMEDRVFLGGDRVVILDAAGRMWILTPDQAAAFDPNAVNPTRTFDSADLDVTVTTDGDVYVLHGDTLTPYLRTPDQTTPAAEPAEEVELEGITGDADTIDLTAVGSEPVVLDREASMLHVGVRDRRIPLRDAGVADVADALLQEPSVAGDGVLLATADSLYDVPLDGGDARRDKTTGSGDPIAPVRVAGCAYGAWNGSTTYLRRCGDADPAQGRIERASGDAQLHFRVNHELVVLNDDITGLAWMAADKMQIVETWELPTDMEFTETVEKENETLTSTVTNVPPDQQEQNRPPVANPDQFGVRPGGSVVLPVVANDTDPDGDVLVAAPVDQPPIGTVTPIRGGTALQIAVAEDATGQASFSYSVSDGRENGEATSQVTLDVHGPESNTGPQPETGQTPKVTIAAGATVSFNVLPHFRDPEGDDFFLASAEVDGKDDQVTFRPDGMVTFDDAGITTGDKKVKLTFRDALGATSEGEMIFAVEGAEDLEPITTPDHVEGVTGRTLTVKPLENDLNPTGEDLELLQVGQAEGLTVKPDPRSGTFEIQAASTGTKYLTYQTGVGTRSVQGIVRVDVREPTGEALAPVAVGDLGMVVTGGSVLVDPIENDVDPTGGVLVVDRASVPPDSSLQVEVIDHHLLKINADPAAPHGGAPIELGYEVSNASGTTTGTVRVLIVPPETQMPYPVVVEDEALVRSGDVARIPVLANDKSPSGAPLELEGIADASGLDGKGTAELSEDQVRFVAAPGASGEASFTYTVVDDAGRRATGRATIRIVPESDLNDPPDPQPGEARAIAGTTTRIPVVTSGIDPDGDATLLTSITAPAPQRGRVVKASGEWIEYEAYPDASGTDTLTYQVMDSDGAVGTAQIAVGVVAAPETNEPPVTTADTIRARPDRDLQMYVLGNDTDPEGQPLSIERALTPEKQSLTLIDQGETQRIPSLLTRTPTEPGTYSIAYGASDGQTRSPGSATVIVDADAPRLPPLARDDYVDPADVTGEDRTAVRVDVLANDQDPDGSVEDLEVTLDPSATGATVGPDQSLSIPLAEKQQRVRYTVTDQDGGASAAFVWIPGSAAQAPQWIGEPVQVRSGESVDIDLRDDSLVRVRTGAAGATIADATSASASHNDGGELVASPTTLRYTARADFHGTDTISVDVTDGQDASDPSGARGTLLIPVEVSSSTNQPPTLQGTSVEVEQGKAAVPLDLAAGARDPEDDQLAFATGEFAEPEGVSVDLSSRGQLLIEATTDAQQGAAFEIPVSVSDGTNDPVRASVKVTVKPTLEALISPGVDDVVVDAGTEQTVPVLANDSNPFPNKPRTVSDPQRVAGEVEGRVEGDSVVVSARAGWHGTATLTYRVADATGDPARTVTGTIRAAVRDRPEPPSAPRIVAVGDGSATLEFSPGGDNGAPITGYRVLAASGGGESADCSGTTCTISGLVNGTTYTFQAIAINEVGESDPSSASAVARPDVKPDPPAAPQAQRGDGALDVSWSAPTNRGSALERYEVQIMGTGGGAADTRSFDAATTSTTWEGLANGTEYRFRLRAFNGGDEASDWSPWSSPEHPAGPPKRPSGTPDAQRVVTPLGGGVTVTVPAMSADEANGEPITEYIVTASPGGQSQRVPAGKRSVTFQGLDPNTEYTFTYKGVNSVGESAEPSSASEPVLPYSVPEAPGGVTASIDPAKPSGQATVSWQPAKTNGTDLTAYKITWQGGEKTVRGDQTSVVIGGLANGTSYRFRVQADNGNAGGQSELSAESPAVVPYTNPQTPTVSGKADACSASPCTVTFTAAAHGDGGAGPVTLSYSLDGGAFQPYSGPVKASGDGSAHSITVRATNAKGLTADASASATAGTPPPPPPPAPKAEPTIASSPQNSFGDYITNSGCTSTQYCRQVTITLSGLEPGKRYSAHLESKNPDGQLVDWGQETFVADANGRWSYADAQAKWAYGYPDVPLHVHVDDTPDDGVENGVDAGSVTMP